MSLIPLLQLPAKLLLHDIDLLRQHPGRVELVHEDFQQLYGMISDELGVIEHGEKLLVCAGGVAARAGRSKELEHVLIVPGLGDVVVELCGTVDHALDGVAAVIDKDDGRGEAVADYCTELLYRVEDISQDS